MAPMTPLPRMCSALSGTFTLNAHKKPVYMAALATRSPRRPLRLAGVGQTSRWLANLSHPQAATASVPPASSQN